MRRNKSPTISYFTLMLVFISTETPTYRDLLHSLTNSVFMIKAVVIHFSFHYEIDIARVDQQQYSKP